MGGLGRLGLAVWLLLAVGRQGFAEPGASVRPVETPTGQRKLWISVRPEPVKGRQTAALLVLHARASTPGQIERLTGFSQMAREEGFVVAYPEGVEGHWNDGRSDAFPANSGQDDPAYLMACLDLLVADESADARRLYVVGFDSGGSLALATALKFPGRLAGVAACMSGLSRDLEASLTRPCSTPLLLVQSERDPCVPWAGGAVRYFGGRSRGQVLASDRLVQLWSGLQQPTQTSILGSAGTRESWGPGVVRVHLTGAGHIWPGTEAPVSEDLFGPCLREVSASQLIWDFFRGRP